MVDPVYLTMGELHARIGLMRVPDEARLFVYVGADGVKVQAEWSVEDDQGFRCVPHTQVILAMPSPPMCGGPAVATVGT